MKRLTEKGHFYTEDQVFINICALNISQCLNRLRQYEDTELTPDQILEIDELYAEKCMEVAELQKAAEYGKWIPVKEMYPQSVEVVIVTRKNCNGSYTTVDEYDEDYFDWISGAGDDVIAWMPLPEPYTE